MFDPAPDLPRTDLPRADLPLGSTVVRDHERCPLRPRLLDYDHDQVASLPAAAGVIFDDLLRRRLAVDLDRPEREEDVAWISPLILPQARLVGKRLYEGYLRSGAYEALLEEGVIEHDPGRAWGMLSPPRVFCYLGESEARAAVNANRAMGIEAYLVAARLDGVVRGPGTGSTRVLDYKTTGTNRGASVPGGYVRRWRGGVDLGPCKAAVEPPVGKPEWWDQLAFYAALLGTRHVGNEVVVVGRGGRTIDVASYRWTVDEEAVQTLLERYLEVGRALAGEAPKVGAGGRCWAYNRLCRAADRCPARGGDACA